MSTSFSGENLKRVHLDSRAGESLCVNLGEAEGAESSGGESGHDNYDSEAGNSDDAEDNLTE